LTGARPVAPAFYTRLPRSRHLRDMNTINPQPVSSAPVMHVVVGDLSLGYRKIGPAADAPAGLPPLLLIMGSSGSMDMWPSELIGLLAADRLVVVFDNRGIGETDNPAGPYPFSQLADDTAGLIAALGLGRLDVMGWSMGGKVAVDLAARHPDSVRRVISYAGDAGGDLAIPPTDQALAVLMDTSAPPEERGFKLLELIFPADFRAAHPDYYRLMPMPTSEVDPEAIGLQNQAIAEWPGVWGDLDGIAAPVLFVTGEQDLMTPPDNAAMMADRVPASSLVIFPDAGHGLMYQDPHGLARAVLQFLAAE